MSYGQFLRDFSDTTNQTLRFPFPARIETIRKITSTATPVFPFLTSTASTAVVPLTWSSSMPGTGGRAAQFTHRVLSSYSGPVPLYFGYNVEQFSYILIASGCLGSVVFVVAFYIVMYCKKVIDRRRNARWLAMGFSPSTDSGFPLEQAEYYARSEVFLVHFPNMPRSTTDVYLGNIGFPPLVPRSREIPGVAAERNDQYIRLTPDDVAVRIGNDTRILLPERLI